MHLYATAIWYNFMFFTALDFPFHLKFTDQNIKDKLI